MLLVNFLLLFEYFGSNMPVNDVYSNKIMSIERNWGKRILGKDEEVYVMHGFLLGLLLHINLAWSCKQCWIINHRTHITNTTYVS